MAQLAADVVVSQQGLRRPRASLWPVASRSESRDPFWLVGHRGSPVHEVENTLESCIRAVEEGANAVEIDVSITSDRELVLWHDDDPNEARARFRQWGLEPYVGFRPVVPRSASKRKLVSEMTLTELRATCGYAPRRPFADKVDCLIPTLAAFFEWAARERRLGRVFLDVKMVPERIALLPRFLERLDTLLDRIDPQCQVVLESAHPEIVAAISERDPRRRVCIDVEPNPGIVTDIAANSAVSEAIRHRVCCAGAQKPRSITLFPFKTHYRIVERDLELLRRHNAENGDAPVKELCSFVINEPDEMRAMLALPVTAIQTDRPALLRRLFVSRSISAAAHLL